MFKRLLFLTILFVIDGQLQAKWGSRSYICPHLQKPNLNSDQAFSDLQDLVTESKNTNAQKAFIEVLINSNNIMHANANHIKAEILNISDQDKLELSAENYKNLVMEQYQARLDEQIENIKKCNSKQNCQASVETLLKLLLFEKQIKQ